MGQVVTFYRVSKEVFGQLKEAGSEQRFDSASANEYVTLQQSFMGLEYVLSKGQDAATAQSISEIFYPRQTIGGEEFESLSPEEQFEFFESAELISYLDNNDIIKIDHLLNNIPDGHINANYHAKELNDNGIYPQCWNNDNSPDIGFNALQLAEDLANLKAIIKKALIYNDYIFVFMG